MYRKIESLVNKRGISQIKTLGEHGDAKFFIDGKLELSFLIPKERGSSILGVTDKAKEKKEIIKVSEYSRKSSLNANIYIWVLCDKLGKKLNISKNEVYRQNIKNFGVYRLAEIDENSARILMYSWELLGVGWVAEKLDDSKHEGVVVIALYYGSSTYNTAQMSRLIDAIVYECKVQDIETLRPDALHQLKEAWK